MIKLMCTAISLTLIKLRFDEVYQDVQCTYIYVKKVALAWFFIKLLQDLFVNWFDEDKAHNPI